jgi:hypothetical protein
MVHSNKVGHSNKNGGAHVSSRMPLSKPFIVVVKMVTDKTNAWNFQHERHLKNILKLFDKKMIHGKLDPIKLITQLK